jgi:uncharacterized protein
MEFLFEPIRLERQAEYLTRFRRCDQIASEYSFINLWGWAPEYGLEWAWHDNLVWIRQARPFPAMWAPVGDWNTIDWRAAVPMMAAAAQRVVRVPAKLLEIWKSSVLPPRQVIESRGQWDYLYNRMDLVNLSGNRYHKKKNLVNQFKKKYDFTYHPFGPQMIEQALAMQEDWCTWRDCESHETLASENEAIKRILAQWQSLDGITGGAICAAKILVAYTIAERMPDNSVVIHFEKANPDYKGSYQAINQLFLQSFGADIAVVNREQDLDNEGLRKAKLSYLPIDFLRKYEVLVI